MNFNCGGATLWQRVWSIRTASQSMTGLIPDHIMNSDCNKSHTNIINSISLSKVTLSVCLLRFTAKPLHQFQENLAFFGKAIN